MVHIRLRLGEWEYDPNAPLGPAGGFGEVFKGTGEEHGKVAVKRLKITALEAAHRELRLAEDLAERTFTHVIPIFDSGWDSESDSYFIIMPQAERSLNDDVKSGHSWSDQEAAAILLQIVKGLDEVADIVHRDLKPGNVLFHEGRWKIADFGIARFVEDATSLQTLKGCLTPPFAAPEQWRMERSTEATDLYALGCIACVLLTGKPPFPGPGKQDFQEQHLSSAPPPLDGHLPLMSSLVSMLLRKPPQSRPSRERVIRMLEGIPDAQDRATRGDGAAALAHVNASVEREAASRESRQEALKSKKEERTQLMQEAQKTLKEIIVETLVKQILEAAPSAVHRPTRKAGNWSDEVTLGQGVFRIWSESTMFPEDAFPSSRWDIVTAAAIAVGSNSVKQGWAASLWYGTTGEWSDYRWFEVAYFKQFDSTQGPFLLTDLALADRAAGPALDTLCQAYPPRPIDDEDAERFYRRWIALFTKVAEGKLQPPRVLPIPDSFLEELEA